MRANSVCQALNDLVLPVALVVQHNDRDFVTVKASIDRFAGGGVSFKTPPIAGDASAAGDVDLSGNDASTYTPERTMSASNIDRVTSAILTSLTAADRIMNQSWKSHPAHGDPAYDALRQRVQNVIDVQRVLAFRLDDVAGSYFSNSGNAFFLRNSELNAEVSAEDPLTIDPAHLPAGDVGAIKQGSAGDVSRAERSDYGSSIATYVTTSHALWMPMKTRLTTAVAKTNSA